VEPQKLSDIVKTAAGRLARGGDVTVPGISIDTRTLQPGELYFALRGKRLDGHQFCAQAVQAGACGVVVDDEARAGAAGAVLVVDDTTRALGRVAAWYRGLMPVRAVAITGSNGKTTTKEMLGALLGLRHKTLVPQGSYNNDVGVPLTVLRLDRSVEAAVFEIEMNELGGTDRLARICAPEVGVITNIGDTHLEFMKDRVGVAEEKAELLAVLGTGGTAVLNSDDHLVMDIGARFPQLRRLTFGVAGKADVFGSDIREAGLGGVEFRLMGRHPVRLPLPGRHNVLNALGACAAASVLGIEFEAMPAALEGFRPPPMRLRVERLDGVVLVEDCYNANPQSVRAALGVLEGAAPRQRRVAYLGDMRELGEQSAAQHEALGREMAGIVDRLAVVGPEGEHTARGALAAGLDPRRLYRFTDSRAAAEALFDIVRVGDTILVKGSRATAMEAVSQEIRTHYGRKAG
jgi:UDP-N-acetylmuramoyl-tripeptide--D-alanyl-D-alanine ligase